MGNVGSSIKGFFTDLGYTLGWGAKTVLTPLNQGIGKIGSYIPRYGAVIAEGTSQAQAWLDRLGGLYAPDARHSRGMPTRQIDWEAVRRRPIEQKIGAELQKSFDEQAKLIGQPITSREDIARIQQQRMGKN